MFCACSRIRSSSAFPSITSAATPASCAFEPIVLSSRPISWTTKSSLRPTAPAAPQQLARVLEVRVQSDQLLGDVEAVGHQRRLLRHAAGFEAGLAAQIAASRSVEPAG